MYYKVLLQYYSVLQSPTPVLLCTTKSSPVLQSITPTTPLLLCTTRYTAVLLCTKQYYSLLHRTTPAQVMLQRHQMLSLPRKIALMINPLDACNAIYNARSNTSHPPTSPNAAPATVSWSILLKHETLFTMRAAAQVILRRHQMLRLPLKFAFMINPLEAWNAICNARSSTRHPPTSPNAAPATKNSAHDQSSWSMKRHLDCAEQQASPSNLTKYCACHAKLHSQI